MARDADYGYGSQRWQVKTKITYLFDHEDNPEDIEAIQKATELRKAVQDFYE